MPNELPKNPRPVLEIEKNFCGIEYATLSLAGRPVAQILPMADRPEEFRIIAGSIALGLDAELKHTGPIF